MMVLYAIFDAAPGRKLRPARACGRAFERYDWVGGFGQ